MWEDCGKTGCAGNGGSFLLFLVPLWLMAMWVVIFSEPESLVKYLKSFPSRVFIAVLVTLPFLGIGWLITRLGL